MESRKRENLREIIILAYGTGAMDAADERLPFGTLEDGRIA